MRLTWKLQNLRSAELVRILTEELKIGEFLARLLVQRGLDDPDLAKSFLSPSLSQLHDPFLMSDMDRVVDRIFQATMKGEKILIYGDYDVDGITSTVILKRALEMLGAQVDFHIPHRLQDGYGLKKEVIQKAKEDGYSVVISADSGIRAFEVAEIAAGLGIDLVVTDHHLPADELPRAYAILNPRRNDCRYPEKELAAVGVVFKLVQALFERADKQQLVPHFLKLVAIGTVADVVPLVGENRIIVKFGLEGLSRPHNLGLRELLKGSGVAEEVDFFDIGFKVAPRINAVTRMGGGREVVDLFDETNPQVVRAMVEDMNLKNSKRRDEEAQILKEVEARLEQEPSLQEGRHLLVMAGQDWHRGVIGIVASRLAERFYRPALVLSIGKDNIQGSGRGIPDFNLVAALEHCQRFFSSYGGHAQAVGCTLPVGDEVVLADLAQCLNQYAAAQLSSEQLVPSLDIDQKLPVETLSMGLVDELQLMAPFGNGNPLPVFASENVPVAAGPWVLKQKHLKLQINSNGDNCDAIWWRRGEIANKIKPGAPVDLAYTLSKNTFQGQDRLLLTLQDLRTRG